MSIFNASYYMGLSPRNWWMNIVILLMLRDRVRSITLTQEDQDRWDAWKGSDTIKADDNEDGSMTISLIPCEVKVDAFIEAQGR